MILRGMLRHHLTSDGSERKTRPLGFSFCLVPLKVFSEVFVEPRTRFGVAFEHPAVGMGLKPGDERYARPRKAVCERLVVLRGHYAVRPDRLRNIWG